MTAAASAGNAPVKPQILGVSGRSKLQLAKHLTPKARRIVKNKTEKLMKKRSKVDATLQQEAARDDDSLRPADFLTRQHIIRLDDALARREARHLRTRAKAIEERERLYKWDPSTERQIDLDLLRKYHFIFQRHLGSSLPERQRPGKASELDDDTDGSDGDEADGRADVPGTPSNSGSSSGTSSSSDNDSDSDNDSGSDSDGASDSSESKNDDAVAPGSKNGSTNGSNDLLPTNLDGAFDDYVQEKPKKRKQESSVTLEQVQRKKAKRAKKEQDVGSQFLQSSMFPANEEDNSKDNSTGTAAIDSMSQSKKPHKMNINTNTTTTATATATTTNDTPWYQTHAQRQLQPDFNDLVSFRPNSRYYHPKKDTATMGGARNASPRSIRSGGLPSPEATSSPASQFPVNTQGTGT